MTVQKLITYILLYVIVGLSVVTPLQAARHWVGSGTPAGYDAHYAQTSAGLQSAINAAAYGDKIVIGLGTIGSVNVNLPYKAGTGWIDVEGEGLANLPAGYRVGAAHTAYLPKLQAASGGPAITADVTAHSASVQTTENTLTDTSHGLAEGTPITIDAERIGVYVCSSLNTPDADCTSTRVEHFNHRLGTVNWASGTPFWIYGHPSYTLTGFSWNRWYYTSSSVTGRFKVAETSGGAEMDLISPTTDSATTCVAAPYPIEPDRVYYVRNPTANTFQVSTSASGAIVDIETAGVSVTYRRLDRKVRGWRFRGLEIEQASGNSDSQMLIYLGSDDAPRHFAEQPSHFVFDRMYVHGQPWQDGPTRSFYLNARDVTITNSTITENKTFDSGQSQAIFALNSSGNLWIENNELSAQGESVMTGGARIDLVGYQPTNLVYRRNYFHRPLEWYIGVYLSRQSATLLRAQTWWNTDTCTAANALVPGQQCFAYRPNNETRCIIDEDSDITLTNSGTGLWGFGVKDDCTFVAITTGTGTFTPTGDITHEAQGGGSLDWTGIVTRIRSGTYTSGSISSTVTSYRLDMRHNLESKAAKQVRVEGNVFNGGWYASGNISGADCHIALNVRPSGGTGGPVSYWAESSEHVLQNNIFKNAICSFTTAGHSDNSVQFELGSWRQGGRNVFRNNLLYEQSSYNWGVSTSAVNNNKPIYMALADNMLIDHNTVVDVGFYSVLTASPNSRLFNHQTYSNNIFIPRVGATSFAHITNTDGGGSGAVGVFNNECDSGTCSWLKNAILNPSSTSQNTQYNTSGATSYLMGVAAGADATERLNTHIAALNFADFSNRNFRIAAGTTYGAGGANQATDGRQLGADQDEIEALTGTLGGDVIAGIPEFSRRSNLVVTPSTTSIAFRLTPEEASACTISAWSSRSYDSSTLIDSDTTNGGTSRQTVTLTGFTTATPYYYKVICGTSGADGIAVSEVRTR